MVLVAIHMVFRERVTSNAPTTLSDSPSSLPRAIVDTPASTVATLLQDFTALTNTMLAEVRTSNASLARRVIVLEDENTQQTGTIRRLAVSSGNARTHRQTQDEKLASLERALLRKGVERREGGDHAFVIRESQNGMRQIQTTLDSLIFRQRQQASKAQADTNKHIQKLRSQAKAHAQEKARIHGDLAQSEQHVDDQAQEIADCKTSLAQRKQRLEEHTQIIASLRKDLATEQRAHGVVKETLRVVQRAVKLLDEQWPMNKLAHEFSKLTLENHFQDRHNEAEIGQYSSGIEKLRKPFVCLGPDWLRPTATQTHTAIEERTGKNGSSAAPTADGTKATKSGTNGATKDRTKPNKKDDGGPGAGAEESSSYATANPTHKAPHKTEGKSVVGPEVKRDSAPTKAAPTTTTASASGEACVATVDDGTKDTTQAGGQVNEKSQMEYDIGVPVTFYTEDREGGLGQPNAPQVAELAASGVDGPAAAREEVGGTADPVLGASKDRGTTDSDEKMRNAPHVPVEITSQEIDENTQSPTATSEDDEKQPTADGPPQGTAVATNPKVARFQSNGRLQAATTASAHPTGATMKVENLDISTNAASGEKGSKDDDGNEVAHFQLSPSAKVRRPRLSTSPSTGVQDDRMGANTAEVAEANVQVEANKADTKVKVNLPLTSMPTGTATEGNAHDTSPIAASAIVDNGKAKATPILGPSIVSSIAMSTKRNAGNSSKHIDMDSPAAAPTVEAAREDMKTSAPEDQPKVVNSPFKTQTPSKDSGSTCGGTESISNKPGLAQWPVPAASNSLSPFSMGQQSGFMSQEMPPGPFIFGQPNAPHQVQTDVVKQATKGIEVDMNLAPAVRAASCEDTFWTSRGTEKEQEVPQDVSMVDVDVSISTDRTSLFNMSLKASATGTEDAGNSTAGDPAAGNPTPDAPPPGADSPPGYSDVHTPTPSPMTWEEQAKMWNAVPWPSSPRYVESEFCQSAGNDESQASQGQETAHEDKLCSEQNVTSLRTHMMRDEFFRASFSINTEVKKRIGELQEESKRGIGLEISQPVTDGESMPMAPYTRSQVDAQMLKLFDHSIWDKIKQACIDRETKILRTVWSTEFGQCISSLGPQTEVKPEPEPETAVPLTLYSEEYLTRLRKHLLGTNFLQQTFKCADTPSDEEDWISALARYNSAWDKVDAMPEMGAPGVILPSDPYTREVLQVVVEAIFEEVVLDRITEAFPEDDDRYCEEYGRPWLNEFHEYLAVQPADTVAPPVLRRYTKVPFLARWRVHIGQRENWPGPLQVVSSEQDEAAHAKMRRANMRATTINILCKAVGASEGVLTYEQVLSVANEYFSLGLRPQLTASGIEADRQEWHRAIVISKVKDYLEEDERRPDAE